MSGVDGAEVRRHVVAVHDAGLELLTALAGREHGETIMALVDAWREALSEAKACAEALAFASLTKDRR